MGFIIWLIVGGVVGWLASLIMRTDAQQGIILNIVVGIVGAVIAGLVLGKGNINQGLTVDEACQRYTLSLEEFTSWQRAVDRSGMPGLRVTRIKQYRDQYERQQRY